MLSTKTLDTHAFVSAAESVAVYKGLTVAVYKVDKTEVNLTRQDLIELINVCCILQFITYVILSIVWITYAREHPIGYVPMWMYVRISWLTWSFLIVVSKVLKLLIISHQSSVTIET